MARPLSADALDVIVAGARYTSQLTITLPVDATDSERDPEPVAGEPVVVNIEPGWSVTETFAISGSRLGVPTLRLLPTDGIDDLFAFAGWPGARYELKVGIVLGAQIETVTVFTGYVVEGSMRRLELGVELSLKDGWPRDDRTALVSEYKAPEGAARATTIIELLTPVMADVETVVEDMGGYFTKEGIYTGSRSQAAGDIAKDGLLQAGFNGSGQLVIKAQPSYAAGDLTPDWEFVSGAGRDQRVWNPLGGGGGSYGDTYQDIYGWPGAGASGSFTAAKPPVIIDGTLKRSRPWDEGWINTVTVKPGGAEQTCWKAQTASLSNTSDPRHESYIGVRSIEIVSDTIANETDAAALAQTTLTRHLRATDESVSLQVLLNPAVEVGDVIWVAALPTLGDTGWNNTYIVTSATHVPPVQGDTSTGLSSIQAMTTTGYDLTLT